MGYCGNERRYIARGIKKKLADSANQSMSKLSEVRLVGKER